MSDKKELKNDEMVESGEKLVSRAASGRLNVINNASQPIIIYEEYDYPNGYTVQSNSTTLISFSVDGTDVSFGAGVSNAVISGTYKRDNEPLYEFTNEKTVQILHGTEDTLTITSVELLPSPIFYLNESYSVPNFVDPEPLEIYVWMRYVTINDIFFTDSSNNIITPIESEISSTVNNREHVFLFTFAPNASIAKIYYTSDSGAIPNGTIDCYYDVDFNNHIDTGTTFSDGMTYGGKYYYGSNVLPETKGIKLLGWMV